MRNPQHPAGRPTTYDNGFDLYPGNVGYNRTDNLIDLSLCDQPQCRVTSIRRQVLPDRKAAKRNQDVSGCLTLLWFTPQAENLNEP